MNAHQPHHEPAPATNTAAVEIEQALLGAILVNNGAYYTVSGFLMKEHFTEPLHALIYEVMGLAMTASRKATPATIAPTMPPDLDVGGLSGAQYLARLAAEATTILNAPDYGKMIFEAHQERQLVAAARAVIEGAGRGYVGQPVGEQLATAEALLGDIRSALRATSDSGVGIAEAAQSLIVNSDEVKAGNIVVPSTGFLDVDRKFGGGCRPGRLIIVAGRPGMGKSVWTGASARRVARQGYGVIIFTLEVDQEETAARIIASELADTPFPLDYRDILSGQLDESDRVALTEGARRVSRLPIHIEYATGITMAEIEARARMVREQFRRRDIVLGAVYIDYLGLVKTSERYRGQKVNELGEVALGAKELSKRLDTCTFLLSQINRAVESRDDKRPMLSDLRDSGNIEEHADAVCFLYRDHYYLEQSPEARAGDEVMMEKLRNSKNDLELIVAKNRLGPTGSVKLWCDVARNHIDNKATF